MRVTNEQAKALVICGKYDWCEECEKYDDGCPIHGCGIIFEKELAIDILEARETIEKQEAIIKEMHGIIRRYVKLDTRCEVQDNLNSNATSILKKTKEYAE